MNALAQLEKVKALQVTIDKMLEKGSMELKKPMSKNMSPAVGHAGKWILQPLHEDPSCSVGLVHVPFVDIGRCETHIHPGAKEYLIVVSGSILLNVEGRDMRIVREGECCVIDVGQQHHSKPLVDNTTMVYVCIPRDTTIPSLDMEIK